ncbi:2TM domain-containing protein [Flavobacterium silvaticum]|uniref:2TM domain-containing protein n=1 Tax=Flavobacterium silvaticum TaxID=1852020 RepID=A0A972FRY3_9FLAO|nr:2TM domain-containing protein [Flavobacterium silvaticum]
MTHATRSNAVHFNPKKAFRIHLLVILLTTPFIWIIWHLTEKSYPWPIWPTLGWTLGIIFHYLGITVFKKNPNN